jgi:hypothetical protein
MSEKVKQPCQRLCPRRESSFKGYDFVKLSQDPNNATLRSAGQCLGEGVSDGLVGAVKGRHTTERYTA